MEKKETFSDDERILACKTLPVSGATRVRLSHGAAWLLLGTTNVLSSAIDPHRRMVKFIFLHRDSYLGGEYESRGGYDIALLKMFPNEDLVLGGGGGKGWELFLPGKEFV